MAGYAEVSARKEREAKAIAAPILASFGVSLDAVLSSDRTHNTVSCRRAIAEALHADGWHASKIGAFLFRDRTTILHYLGRLDKNGKQKKVEPLEAVIGRIKASKNSVVSRSDALIVLQAWESSTAACDQVQGVAA